MERNDAKFTAMLERISGLRGTTTAAIGHTPSGREVIYGKHESKLGSKPARERVGKRDQQLPRGDR